MLLLQEFDIELKDRKGSENQLVDHLSRMRKEDADEHIEINENFPDEHLFTYDVAVIP